MRLEDYGFEIWDVNDTSATYSIDDGFDTVFIKIDFKYKSIEYYAKDENGKRKATDYGIHIDVIKASVAILESRKIEIDFNGVKNNEK